MTFIFFFILYNITAQSLIGRIDGASITLEDARYEVIFQSENVNDYVSFYINQEVGGNDGLQALKTYIFQLFEEKEGDYLLQFEHDSLLIIYEDDKVQMVLWRQHDGDRRIGSKWFTKNDYLELLGGIAKTDKM